MVGLEAKRSYAALVRTLDRTGSDFAIGAVRRVTRGKFSAPAWVNQVHAYDRLGVRVDDFPEAVRDVIACNRMFRRGFWDRVGLSFPEGVAYEELHGQLKESGFVIYAGQDALARKVFRLANMGQITAADIDRFLSAMEAALSRRKVAVL